jgi:hypothetical protein
MYCGTCGQYREFLDSPEGAELRAQARKVAQALAAVQRAQDRLFDLCFALFSEELGATWTDRPAHILKAMGMTQGRIGTLMARLRDAAYAAREARDREEAQSFVAYAEHQANVAQPAPQDASRGYRDEVESFVAYAERAQASLAQEASGAKQEEAP